LLAPLPEAVRLAVVIPCRNEENYIERCVRSLLEDAYPGGQLMIRVVDGMSDDGTRPIVEALALAHPQVELIDNPDRTTAIALNLGLRKGGYDAAIILGAHAEVEPGFLQANVDALRRDRSVGCAGGIIENVYEGEVARRIGAAMGHPFGVGSAHFRTGRKEGYVDTVAFGCYRHEVFEGIGYFDDELVRNQDDEFNFRVTQAGFRVLLDKRIRSLYYVRASYARLFEQYEQYGFWKVYVNRKHRTVTTVRQLVPALWVAFVLAGLSLSGLSTSIAIGFGLGVLAYLFVALRSAIRAAPEVADRSGVFQAFLVLHAGYGIGYLRGIWELLLLRRSPRTKDHALTRGDATTTDDTVASFISVHGAIAAFLLLAFPFSMSLWPRAAPAFLAMAIIALVVQHWKERGRRLPRITELLWWGGLFYLIHVVGMAWSANKGFGLFDLEVKAALLLVPLLHFAVPASSHRGGRVMMRAFTAGVAVSIVIDVLAAAFRMVRMHLGSDGDMPIGSSSVEFFSSNVSLFLHPSYAAMYAGLAVCWVILMRSQGMRHLLPILLVGIVLFASKIGWVLLVFAMVAMFVRVGRRALLPAFVVITVFSLYTWTSPFMQEKLGQFSHILDHADPPPDATGSSEVRILVWRAASEVIREHWPMGTGTGDVKDELVARYVHDGYSHAAELRLNAHSQFLQSAVALGLPGSLPLVGLVLVPLVNLLRRRDAFGVAFIVLLTLELAVESVLEVQAGVFFLAFGAWVLAWGAGRKA
ncbi:MAG: glycosyltransferase, partial [Flavobacteriales bacterium]|nr:glycosyltransferase [Flavobacteriales bacterium]